MYIMWALQYIHDYFSKWHIDCWELHAKWYPSVKIEEKKSKLNTTSGGGYMEVKVNTK